MLKKRQQFDVNETDYFFKLFFLLYLYLYFLCSGIFSLGCVITHLVAISSLMDIHSLHSILINYSILEVNYNFINFVFQKSRSDLC